MNQRTIVLLGSAALAGALAIAGLGNAFAQRPPQPGAAPAGMMGGQGYGPGMMGGSGYGSGAQAQTQPLTSLDDARQAFQRYVGATGSSDLALDEVMQFQWNYYAIVKEKSTGTGAFELLADPRTGAVFPEMGPDVMWNTKYSPMATFGGGMMGGFGGFTPGGMMSGTRGPTPPTAQPTVTADQATRFAQQWLDQYQPGSATETPDAFPGYSTLHVTKDGQITGMLSVNAYTGRVWYHTWHGAFVASAPA
jgi:hypothetical protein